MIKDKFNILGTINPPMSNSPVTLDIGIIDCDPNNFFAEDEEAETKRIEILAEEIKDIGFRSVIEVKKVNDRYCTIAGETRLKAMKHLYQQTHDPKYQFVPCFVNREDDNMQRRRLIMDNLLQREITPAIRMKAIEELQKTYQAEKEAGKKLPGRISYLIAKDIGLGKTQVGTYQTVINKGSEAVKTAVQKSDITVDAAAKLSKLPKHDQETYLNNNEDYSLKAVSDYVDERNQANDFDDVEELSIYDFIEDAEGKTQTDSCVQVNDEDKKIIEGVIESLAILDDLKFARTGLHSLQNTALASKAEALIEEIQDIYAEVLNILQY